MEFKSVFWLLFGLLIKDSHLQTLHQECGKRLERGSIMCWLPNEEENVEPINFELCTHGVVHGGFYTHCADDKCTFENITDLDERVRWALPNFPEKLGTTFLIDPPTETYLFGSKLRRSNTIEELLNVFDDKGLRFLSVEGWDTFNARPLPTDKKYFIVFLKELATRFHARGYHVGVYLYIERHEDALPSKNSLAKMSEFVDWFSFQPSNYASSKFMRPWTPLKMWFEGTTGTYQHWIERLMEMIPPECLVIDVGPRYKKSTATEKAVDPGLGSIGVDDEYGTTAITQMCYEIDTRNECTEHWDEESSTPWAVCEDDLYSYDDPRSLRLKADLLKTYNITALYFNTESITPDNICNGDAFANLKAIQGFRTP